MTPVCEIEKKETMLQKIIRTMIILWLLLIPYRIATAGAGKTLGRTVDPVVMQGAVFALFSGVPLDQLALLVMQQGQVSPIPFQIDERASNGRFAYETWLAGDPVVDDGLLDANDELVFMAADTGDRADADTDFGADTCAEITLKDPDDDTAGYAYLCRYTNGDAPRSTKDYVDFDIEADQVNAADYILGYDPKAPIAIGKLIVRPSFGGSGQDVADRLKIRVKATVAMNMFSLSRNEEDFLIETTGYTDGPVRVIRRSKSWQNLIWNIPSPASHVTVVYYRNQMSFPINLELPFDMSAFFRDVSMRVSVDTPPNVPGRKYYSDRNPGGVLIDGKMSEAEKNLDPGQVGWQVVAGSTPDHREGWFQRQVVRGNGQKVSMPLFYRDDADTPDGPERFRGSHGNLGFTLSGVQNLKKGSIELYVQQFPLVDYKPGDEDRFLKVLDRPLETEVRRLF